MNLRMLTLAGFTAMAISAQGTAQQGGDLERALADLNNGVIATAPGGASASGSNGVDFSGDMRLRNTDNDTAANGAATRMRVNAAFAVSETTSAFAQWTAGDAWGTGGASGMSQGYITTSDLLGTGGNWQVGTSYHTLGSGRILGTDEWAANPHTYSGAHYSNTFGGMDLGISKIRDTDTGNADLDVITASMGMGSDAFTGIDFAYIMGDGDDNTWWDASAGGAVSMFTWAAEFANADAADASASAITIGMGMGDYSGGFLGDLSVTLTDADGNVTIDPVNHNSLGIADQLGNAWGGDTESTQIGVGLNVMEGYDVGLALISGETAGVDFEETDLTVGKALGGGVDAWLGYADWDTGAATGTTVYVQLSLSF